MEVVDMADEKVIVTKTKLDALAVSISEKSGASLPLTIAQMKAAVDGIFTGNVTQDADGYLVLDKDGTGSGKLMYSLDDYISGEPSGDIKTNATKIKNYCFYHDENITSIIAPNLTTIGAFAFAKTSIVDVELPNVTKVDICCFQECSKLRRLVIGGSGYISANYWIQKCPSLVELRMPNATFTSMNGFGFQGNTSINIYDIGFSASLYMSNLEATAPLSVVIMRKNDALVTINNANVLDSLAFKEGGSGGTIYIPKVLYDHLGDGSSLDYKNATNWSTINARGTITWMPIEGSEWEVAN
jgi:hypothetical protein